MIYIITTPYGSFYTKWLYALVKNIFFKNLMFIQAELSNFTTIQGF